MTRHISDITWASGTVGASRSLCNCYNRARRRVRNRQTKKESSLDAVVAAAFAAYSTPEKWEPPSGPYLQQVMPGWRVGLVWPEKVCCLAVLTIICGSLAVASFLCWTSISEIELDYTNCVSDTTAVCRLKLMIESNLTAPLYLYYAMRNAYFNHRKIQTWSMPQLMGLPTGNLTKPCGRHAYRDNLPVMPCGSLPNAIFNDTFALLGPLDAKKGKELQIPLSSKGIGWPTDTSSLFQPLPPDRLSGTVRPANWPVQITIRYHRPFADAEDLHVWLRTPAFSSFRRMRHRLLQNLSRGCYDLLVGNNYPVSGFGGTKRLIIAQKSAFGGRNIALVLLPVSAAGCYLLLCIFVLIECQYRKCKRKMSDNVEPFTVLGQKSQLHG